MHIPVWRWLSVGTGRVGPGKEGLRSIPDRVSRLTSSVLHVAMSGSRHGMRSASLLESGLRPNMPDRGSRLSASDRRDGLVVSLAPGPWKGRGYPAGRNGPNMNLGVVAAVYLVEGRRILAAIMNRQSSLTLGFATGCVRGVNS